MEQNTSQVPPETPSPENRATGGQKPKSNSNVIIIVVAVVVVFGIVALVGGYFVMKSLKAKVSQKIGETMVEKAIEKGTGQKVDVNSEGDTVSVKTDSGTWSTSESGNIALPTDFPSDVLVLDGAKITFATSTPANAADGTKASFMIGYETNQSVNDVANKYREEMVKNGWTKDTEANFGAMMINFKKGTREALVTISDSQGEKAGVTGVSVAVSEN